MQIGENRFVSLFSVAIAGFVAGIAMAGFLAIMEGLELINFSWMNYLGVLVGLAPGNTAWLVGLLIHLVAGVACAFAYASAFQHYDRSGVSVGSVISTVHWLAIGILIGVIETFHPVATTYARTPGYLWTGFTFETFGLMFIAFWIYGATVGGVFHRFAVREALELTAVEA